MNHSIRSGLLGLLVLGVMGATVTACSSGDSGGSAGSAGSTTGTGGASAGSGGAKAGTGGTSAGAGGSTAGSGGTSAGAGGATAGAGGATGGSGGTSAGAGGATAGSGGTSAGAGGATAGAGGATAGAGGATAGAGGASAGAGGASGGSGGSTASPNLSVYGPAAKKVAPGGDVKEVNLDGITPFSDGVIDISLTNDGSAPMTIESVTFTPVAPTLEGEWTLSQAGSTAVKPIKVENVALAPTKSTSFGVFFSPWASGTRQVTVDVKHEGGKVFTFTVTGRGRDNFEFSPKVSATKESIYGDPGNGTDIVSGGMVSDASGNVWATANTTQWLDKFTGNIAVHQIKPDGTLAWAKIWNETFDQRQPDPGQNAESGGGADSLVADATHLYAVGKRSLNNSNSIYQTLVMKIDKATGAMVWARGLTMGTEEDPPVGSKSSEGYAIDARMSDRVLVTGAANGMVTLFAVDKTTGSLIFDQQIDVAAGLNDRGHTVASDGKGNAYIGGISNARPLLMRVKGVDGATPALDWVKSIQSLPITAIGANFNSLDIDPTTGDVYAALDRRGAQTFFSLMRVSTAGSVVWAKTWDDQNTGDNDNIYVVRYLDGNVYAGGRIAFTPADTQSGDGFLLSVKPADGAYGWSSYYYTGKGTEEITEHRVKGIGLGAGGTLQTLMQSYTGPNNIEHYWGFWYQSPDRTLVLPAGDGAVRHVDLAITFTDDLAKASMTDIAEGTAHTIDTTALWVDPQATATLEPLKTRKGPGGDGASVVQTVKLTP
ncbi:MAG: hypothetical protein IT374_07760 [Polyangiaceae bacterium]|nr:hypothetical protein [Polyangiaceae bacterium]